MAWCPALHGLKPLGGYFFSSGYSSVSKRFLSASASSAVKAPASKCSFTASHLAWRSCSLGLMLLIVSKEGIQIQKADIVPAPAAAAMWRPCHVLCIVKNQAALVEIPLGESLICQDDAATAGSAFSLPGEQRRHSQSHEEELCPPSTATLLHQGPEGAPTFQMKLPDVGAQDCDRGPC
eukprot:CAMPEP_0206249486 /NCGR_PEP_ID=MMETSP0047_2-20121206/20934_1 /ASSEMBLY_ACC=CAM_ASM_000192 /TAXON_ID=195065 /ORGANISM="Chroomonas mesostigmatica_cf, Strain CCMP1168" /LENGTH=178 /DNA_ID=CAMNT_0053675211 /DNA_START=87 /DNA_END=621 /DNA_ORIENTATION=+